MVVKVVRGSSYMDVVYWDEVVKCLICEKLIYILVGWWFGGINDFGGWVFKCISCGYVFFVNVKNFDDVFRVDLGVIIFVSWDNDVGNCVEVLVVYGIKEVLV